MLACGSESGISISGIPGKPGPFNDKESLGMGNVPMRLLICASLPGGGTSKSVVYYKNILK